MKFYSILLFLFSTTSFATPTQLGFVSPIRYTDANTCSAYVGLESQDSDKTPDPVTSNTLITLQANSGTVVFYANSTCTKQITYVTLLATKFRAPNFFIKDSVLEPITLTASATGLSSAQQNEVGTNPAVSLGFYTNKRSTYASTCSKYIGIETLDGNNNIASVTSPTVVTMAGSSTTQFFSNNTCTIPISTVTIKPGLYRPPAFYFVDTTIEEFSLTVSASGLTGAQQVETSLAPKQHSVSLTWVASTGPDVQGYDVYRGTVSGGPYTQIGSTSSVTLDYLDTNVVDGDTYYYVTTAFNSEDVQSVYSNEAKAVIPTP